jgi:4-hydroxy-3-polyprenylbenzoate decarboxylase
VGLPPQEDYFLGKTTERLFLPLLKTIVPDIEDYDLPMFGTFHNCAFLKVKKHYPLQGRRLMHSVWGAGQMAWTKSIIVVDDDVDIHDTAAVLRAAGANCHPLRDIETVRGPLDILDHAAPRLGAGTKIGFDCTRKVDGEQAQGIELSTPAPTRDALAYSQTLNDLAQLPGVLEVSASTTIAGWLLIRIDKTAPGQGARVIEHLRTLDAAQVPPFTLVLGADTSIQNFDDAFFHWLAHSDAGRDMQRWSSPDGLHHRVAFDATPKLPGDERNGEPVREWPPLLRMSKDVVKRAESRRAELGK